MAQPVTLARPRSAHCFKVFSLKTKRRLTFDRRFAADEWLVLESDPTALAFCERPGFILIGGQRVLADFQIRYAERLEFGLLSKPAIEESIHARAELDPSGMKVRLVEPAELVASRIWVDNWQRMLPCLIPTRGLVPASLPNSIERFIATSQSLLDIEVAHAHTLCCCEGPLKNRRKPEPQARDLTIWPTVAWTEFDAPARRRIRFRIQAIERYARGEPVKDIEHATGLNRRQFYRLLEWALEPHREGRIYDFRALIAHVRVAEYVRVRPVTAQGERGSRGAVGALSQLLERYSNLGR